METREADIIDQPSTKTNSSNLKGSEINIGESIIIPSDISIEEITMSITKNGKNMRNPIWKAVFNSDVMNAGSITEKGISAFEAKGLLFAKSEKIIRMNE